MLPHRPGIVVLLVALAGRMPGAPLEQSQADASIRLARSVSGTRGIPRGGGFEIEDPRDVFNLPQDRQVLVYFEWEGVPPGPRRFEGRWKDPSGAVVLVAPAEQPASGRRFGIYWTLALPATAAPGLWAIEAFIDGKPAGTHAFEVRGGRPPLLSTAQLYERARMAAARVERLGAAGEITGIGVATALDADFVVAPFDAIDGATTLRILMPDGRRLETREVGAWSRRDGWAALRVPGHGLAPLPPGAATGVGQVLFALDTHEDGATVIGQTSVVGESTSGSGRRLLLADGVAAGSPVLNGSGEQVGVTVFGGEAILGEAGTMLVGSARFSRSATLMGTDSLPHTPGAAVTTLADLAARGQFMRPLSPERKHVVSGVFAANVQRGGVTPMPQDQRTSFSRREGRVFVFVQWHPQGKRNAASSYEVFDAENKVVTRSNEAQLKLRPGELMFSSWGFGIDRLPAGVYRVELLLAQEPVWRGWVRVTD